MTGSPPIAGNALDLQGLEQLRRGAARDNPAALTEVAAQFDAMFIGMMLDSARSANLGGGLLDGPETKQYLELMDRQVALEMARHGGLGFGKLLLQQITPPKAAPQASNLAPLPPPSPAQTPVVGATAPVPGIVAVDADGVVAGNVDVVAAAPPAATTDGSALAQGGTESDPTAFVTKLLPEAKRAAAALGVDPKLLLAQAALETGWGSAAPRLAGGTSSNNLFGIKAGTGWGGDRAAQWTTENTASGAQRRHEEFRAYANTAASFSDYVDLIASKPRYAQALANAADPQAYTQAVQAAGYATDPAYADKWLAIYRGARLDNALRSLDGAAPAVGNSAGTDSGAPLDGTAL